MILSPEAAIRAAETAIEEIKEEYPARLHGHIEAMEAAADAGDLDRLATLAHDVKGEAGTMGWPLVSQSAGWLRQVIEQPDTSPDPEVVSVFLQSIRRLSEPDLEGESKEGVRLIKELYALCINKNVDIG